MQTIVLVLVTTAVSIYALMNPRLLDRLMLAPTLMHQKRQYERFVTHGFVHGDNQHLLFNMITLYFFGRTMEGVYDQLIGPFGFTLFYLAALVFSILPTYVDEKQNYRYRSLGASGAVSAVLFAFILFAPWSTIYVIVLPVPAILYAVLYIGWEFYSARERRDNINHSAHLWGAAFGVACTLALAPQVLGQFVQRLMNP